MLPLDYLFVLLTKKTSRRFRTFGRLIISYIFTLQFLLVYPMRLVPLNTDSLHIPHTLDISFFDLNHVRMLRAEAVLNASQAQGLDCGAYVPVTMVLETKEDVTLVPTSAIVESPTGRPTVFVVVEGTLQAVEATVLGRTDDQTAVEGIEPGADVVLSTFLGWSRLSSGLVVEAVQ